MGADMEQYWDAIVIITEIVNVMITGFLIGMTLSSYIRSTYPKDRQDRCHRPDERGAFPCIQGIPRSLRLLRLT